MCWSIILAQCFTAIYALTLCYHEVNLQNRKKTREALTLASDSGHKPQNENPRPCEPGIIYNMAEK